MKPFAILSDSSCNLTSAQQKEYGVDAVLPMHFYLDEKEYEASNDWKEIGAHEYYDAIRAGARVRSSQASAVDYERVFRSFLAQGYDILSLSCAEALSSSVKESVAAANKLKEEFPDAVIECIDTHNCCYSLALLLQKAAALRAAGQTLEQVRDAVLRKRQGYNEVGTVDKLTYLRNAGRVSASAAFFGGVFSVKPIIVYDEEGHNVALEKVRGRKASLARVAEYIQKYADFSEDRRVCIAHGDCEEDAAELAKLVQALFPEEKIDFTFGYIEPGIGSAVGPGTLIVGFYGSPEMRKLNG